VVLGDDCADGRILFRLRILAGLSGSIGRLKDFVGLVVAEAAIDRADQREAVEHRRLLGQVLAQEDARQFAGRHAERSAILRRAVRLGVPRIDMAWPAGHPQEDDALARFRPALFSSDRLMAKELRDRKSRHACQTRLEHAAPAANEHSFALSGAKGREGMHLAGHTLLQSNEIPIRTF
jgi:hypothetical protein